MVPHVHMTIGKNNENHVYEGVYYRHVYPSAKNKRYTTTLAEEYFKAKNLCGHKMYLQPAVNL